MKYIFFDIDGTLFSHSEGISQSTVEALRMAKENGHKIFINTGRSLAELGESFAQFNFDGYVLAAGSHIIIEGKTIFEQTIDHDKVLELLDYLESHKVGLGIEGEKFTYFSDDAFEGYRKKVYEVIDQVLETEPSPYEPYNYMIHPKYVRRVSDFLEHPTKVYKMLIYGTSVEENMVIKGKLPEGFDLLVYQNSFCELINASTNKATGIEEVVKYYGASMEDTIAIGDSLNDLDMIKAAGLGVAMGNSSQPVKDAADYITDDVKEDGIYNCLKKYGII